MRKKRKKKGFRLRHLLMILLTFWLGKTLISQSIMMKDLNERKKQYEDEITQLEEEIQELKTEIDNKDSLEFIEKVARDELKLVKPREIIYIDKNKESSFLKKPTK